MLRVLAWLCVALIALLSLIPQQMEARTGLPGSIEHAIAYAGTAAFLRLGYPLWPLWVIAGALFAYSGLLVALQAFVPGRHPGIDGALASGTGAVLGAALASLTPLSKGGTGPGT